MDDDIVVNFDAKPNIDVLLNVLKKVILRSEVHRITNYSDGVELLGGDRFMLNTDDDFKLVVKEDVELTDHEAYLLDKFIKEQNDL